MAKEEGRLQSETNVEIYESNATNWGQHIG